MSVFTCNSCLIQFTESDLQRHHMKTEWHRYNLKRRVAHLQPVTAETFAEKLLISEQNDQHLDEFGFPYLEPKTKLTEKSLRGRSMHSNDNVERDASPASTVGSHISKFSLGESVHTTDFDTGSEYSYQELSEDEGKQHDVEVYSSGDEEDADDDSFPLTSCFYCGKQHRELEQNITHMFKFHGLYIPERTYLVDLEGMLRHIAGIVIEDLECLCCNFEGTSLESIRQHCIAKGHCRIPYETHAERYDWAEFYDFSSRDEVATKAKTNKSVGFAASSDEEESDDEDTNSGNQENYRDTRPRPEAPERRRPVVAVSDRRLMGGMTLKQYNKMEKQIRTVEQRQQSKGVAREVKRCNFQTHFRDQMLGG